jgi:uncharacterized membrane protein YtjA (UPF0391 family)
MACRLLEPPRALAALQAARVDHHGVNDMLNYALIFLVVALIAGVLGFGGIAGAAAGIAKILFFVFLVLFLGSLLLGGFRRTVP